MHGVALPSFREMVGTSLPNYLISDNNTLARREADEEVPEGQRAERLLKRGLFFLKDRMNGRRFGSGTGLLCDSGAFPSVAAQDVKDRDP